MKKCILAAIVAAFCGTVSAKQGIIKASGFTWENDGPVVPGEWNSQYNLAMKTASETRTPLIAFYARATCGNCKTLEKNLVTDEAKAWFKERGFILLFGLEGSGDANKVFNLSLTGMTLPLVGLWWDKDGDGESEVNNAKARKGGPWCKSFDDFKNWVESYFGDYSAYDGGSFEVEESDYNRLECEDGTDSVDIVLTRNGTQLPTAQNRVVATYPNGKTVTNVVDWAEGQTAWTNALDVSVETAGFAADGEQVEVVVYDMAGDTHGTNHVTYVKQQVPTSSNPLWKTDRSDPFANGGIAKPLEHGEWTMDLTAAKHLTENTAGDAYTLVLVTGALWCPNCDRFERNFLSLTNEAGEIKFVNWAKRNQVALAVVDVPPLTGGTVMTPTLLSRQTGTGYFDKDGKETQVVKSGLGYLTRKKIDDKTAADQLAENCRLARTFTDKGGFIRPEDTEDASCNGYRPRVPCFYILRKDGTCAARMTRFSFPKTPTESDRKWYDSYEKRFDEMLAIAGKDATAHADTTEVENDYSGVHSTEMTANGGTASGELCCADLRDTFKLTGFGGNAELEVKAEGESDAQVALTFWRIDKDGTNVVKGAYQGGRLTDVVTLSKSLPAGEYYVQIQAKNVGPDVDYLDAEFSPTSTKKMNFTSYQLTSRVKYVPAASVATGAAPADSTAVSMLLTSNVVYRFEGLDWTAQSNLDALDVAFAGEGYALCVAKKSGWTDLDCAAKGGQVTYQRWEPGQVGFEPDYVTLPVKKTTAKDVEITRKETDDVEVKFRRLTGVSGDVKVLVKLNVEETDFYYDCYWEGTKELPRFKIDGEVVHKWQKEVQWKDGTSLEDCLGSIRISSADAETRKISAYFGPGDVVFDLSIVEQTGAGSQTNTVDNGKFVIHFLENQKPEAGKIAFTGTDHFWAKKLTVYARADEQVTFDVGRLENCEGPVFASVTPSLKNTVTLGGDYDVLTGLFWENHDPGTRTLTVTNLPPAGKSVKLTLKAVTKELKVLSVSNAVTVVSIDPSAPAFKFTHNDVGKIYRYVACSNVFDVVNTQGGTLSFTKLSGTLPAGLKVGWDKARNGIAFYGVPTGNDKAGKTYTVVYQVTEKRPKSPGAKATVSVPGLTAEFTFTVVDPAAPGSGEGGAAINASCATARTFKDLMIFDVSNETQTAELVGTLQLTLPKGGTGKASAKVVCAEGTVSFSSKSWSAIEADGDGHFSATLQGTSSKYRTWEIDVYVYANGSIAATLNRQDGRTLAPVRHDGKLWSAANSAADCEGYYTVTFPVAKRGDKTDAIDEAREGLVTRGSAYLALTMNSKSQYQSGTMKWAGVLPNGKAVSGSSVLTALEGVAGKDFVLLPAFKKVSKDIFAAALKIRRGALELSEEFHPEDEETCYETVFTPDLNMFGDGNTYKVFSSWRHEEGSKYTSDADWTVWFEPYGGIYKSSLGLDCCCILGRGETNMVLQVELPVPSEYYGAFGEVEPIELAVGKKTIVRKDSKGGANKIALTFKSSTGVVSGSFKLGYGLAGKTLTAKYCGVVQLGFGNGCSCATNPHPFVNGCWYFDDKLGYSPDLKTGLYTKWLKTVRGGPVVIDVDEDIPPQ